MKQLALAEARHSRALAALSPEGRRVQARKGELYARLLAAARLVEDLREAA